MPATFLAVDLGASNGRVLAGHWDGARFALEEIHRFPNGPVRIMGSLFWDTARLWTEIQTGISLHSAKAGDTVAGISVDAWGVDFGLLDSRGRLIGNPYHYRDARTNGIPDRVFRTVPAAEVFRQTGVQAMQLNTLYQVFSMVEAGDPHLDAARTLLMIPDLFHYWMTGERKAEYTNATTTQMFDGANQRWATGLLESLGVPTALLPAIVAPGTILGPLRADVMNDVGLAGTVPVIAGATHDTASAAGAVPELDEESAFLSSGTWSLMGVELEAPLINEEVLALSFANEGGIGGKTLLLRNICGLWLLQESLRQWEKDGRKYAWDEVLKLAGEAAPLVSLVDPDAPEFLSPGNMPVAIRAFCRATRQPEPDSVGAIARCCLESLSLKCRWVVEALESLTGRSIRTIRMVGGGSRNTLLCQLTADATNRRLAAGPVEAAALGNVMVQAIATGALPDAAAGRRAIAESAQRCYYEPSPKVDWSSAYGRFKAMLATAVLALCLVAVGCGGSTSNSGNQKQFFVAFSQCNNAEPYRAAQNALMTSLFGKQADVKLVIADAQQDNSKQVAQVETFIRQKPDLLIVAPNERAALTTVMGEAVEANIPVICLERDILKPSYTSYVHSDNVAIGRMAGQFIVDQLKKKNGSVRGNIVQMRGLLGVEGEMNRNAGAKEVFDKYPEVKIVAEPVADWIQAKAKDRMTEVLRSQPAIDVVYGHNDPMAIGAYLAAKELGREKEMIFIGVDGLGGPAGGIKKVMDGVLAATFVYPLCVDKTVSIALKMLHDPKFHPEKDYTLPSEMVTGANAADMYKMLTVPGGN
ncbi:MAG: substrate-binding domain-containing protein [Acidobacteriota bacterium]|nr:substrate-binding domain-containing protein [Acidobacteriota bacterium]